MKRWLKRLLRLVPENRREALEAIAPDVANDGFTVDGLCRDHAGFAQQVLSEAGQGHVTEANRAVVLRGMLHVLESVPEIGQQAGGTNQQAGGTNQQAGGTQQAGGGTRTDQTPDGGSQGSQAATQSTQGGAPASAAQGAGGTSSATQSAAHQASTGAGAVGGGGGGATEAWEQRMADLERRQREADERAARAERQAGRAAIEAAVSELPEAMATFARGQLATRLEADGSLSVEDARGFVSQMTESIGGEGATGRSIAEAVAGRNRLNVAPSRYDKAHRAIAAIDAMLDGVPQGHVRDAQGNVIESVPAFRGLRHMYGVLTGDTYCEGLPFYVQNGGVRGGAIESIDFNDETLDFELARNMIAQMPALEAQTTAAFPLILSDRMHKRAMRAYAEETFSWNMIAAPESVSDFKLWRIQRYGEYSNLPVVAEGGAYLDFDAMAGGGSGQNEPSEEEITLQIQKRGGIATITWEMVLNDNTRRLRDIPTKLMAAARRTLEAHVWDLLLNNTTYQLGGAVFQGAKGNLIQTAISLANLRLMRTQMRRQTDIDDQWGERYVPRNVFVGPTLYAEAHDFIYSNKKPTLTTNDPNNATATPNTITGDNNNTPNILRSDESPGDYRLNLTEVWRFEDVDPDMYVMASSPGGPGETIAVGFLNGQQTPQIFVQDLPRVGAFFDNEQILTKVRHVYRAEIVDYRGLQAGIPT